jgi:hypothetical protein
MCLCPDSTPQGIRNPEAFARGSLMCLCPDSTPQGITNPEAFARGSLMCLCPDSTPQGITNPVVTRRPKPPAASDSDQTPLTHLRGGAEGAGARAEQGLARRQPALRCLECHTCRNRQLRKPCR